ncbi:hypothetical protein BC828DRAFT_390256 [Blastocladiella britannica]|nr:hypothetical protein BC828DRAFT_390256 [Blastocladiella britannica]
MQMGGYGTVSGGGVQYQQQQQQQGQYGGAAPPGPQSYGSYQQQSPPPAGMAMPQQQQQQQQMYGGPGMGNAPFQQQQGMGPVGTAPPQRPLARVLYPYAATEADEMDLMANEVIEILVMDEGGGWARGITMDRRRCGVFPRSYVHIMGP